MKFFKMQFLYHLLAPAFIFYCILLSLLSSGISIFITLFALSTLLYFKNPPPPLENVEAVLGIEQIQKIAHRGGAQDAPENTLESIRTAHKYGADAVELDLEFSSDGIPILMHDETLGRTTDSTAEVKETTYQEMLKLSASANHLFRDQFPDAKIPTLEQAIVLSLELGLKIYLDVKGNADQAVPAIIKMYEKYPALYKNAIVCSFWPRISYEVRLRDHQILSALTYRSRYLTHTIDYVPRPLPMHKKLVNYVKDKVLRWSVYSWLPILVGASAVLLFERDISKETVEYFKTRGVRVIVWTPNAAHDKAYFANTLGISYITDTLTTSHVI